MDATGAATIATLFFNAFEKAITYLAITNGTGKEINPIVQSLLSDYGTAWGLFVAFLIGVTWSVSLYPLRENRGARYTIYGITFLSGLAVVWNLAVLLWR